MKPRGTTILRSPNLLALLVLLYPAAYALLVVAQGWAQVRPEAPWDAALITEGWRVAQGLPLYEAGRASTMYGFAYPVLLASIFYWTGPSLLIPELLSLLSVGVIVLLGGRAVQPYLGRGAYILVGLSFFALDNIFTYYKMSRPDLVAWAFGFCSLLIFYRADASRSLRLYLAGSALLVIAAAFKQPVGTIALIPPTFVVAAALLERRWPSAGKLFLATIPGLSGLAFVAGLKALNPLAYHFMIEVPAQYSVDFRLFVDNLWSFLSEALCLWIALAMRLSAPMRIDEEWNRRVLWSAVSFSVMLPLAQISLAKAGGAPNSLIPAWFTLIVITFMLVAGVRPRGSAKILVALSIMFMTMPGPRTGLNVVRDLGDGNRAYREVIALTAGLEGRVVSPEDPTITLYARGQADESIYFRTDEVRWPSRWPDDIDTAISESTYVVDTRDWFDDLVDSSRLLEAGFYPVWNNRYYVIWRNRSREVE